MPGKRSKQVLSKKQILHLGCGQSKKQGSIGIDILKNSQADIIHDLNKFPYPFRSNQFDEIFAENILEHLDNIPKVMEEIHRICKNEAKIFISTSHFTSIDSFTDPTHKHFFTSRTFDYFIPGTDLYKYHYSKTSFKKLTVFVGPENSSNLLIRAFLAQVNKYLIFYEKHLAYLLPVGRISYLLEVIKTNGKNRT